MPSGQLLFQRADKPLTAAEKNYAQIEKELLSIVFGMEKFETYVYGRNVKVETDHKPLEIICQKSLATSPKGLQRMLLALQKYDFDVVYIPGKQMHMADALSRAYLPYKQAMKGSKNIVFAIDVRSPAEKETGEINALRTVNVSSRSIKEIEKETQKDPVLSQIKTLICEGWPEQDTQLNRELKLYFGFREDITAQDGLVFKGQRIIVPVSLRNGIIERLHESHIGIQGCIRHARECV